MSNARPQLDPVIRRNGKILWDYLRIPEDYGPYPGAPDDRLVMVLGSPDLSVASHAADLLLQGVARYAVVSGGCSLEGRGDLEAHAIRDLMIDRKVDPECVIIEDESRHTSDHFWKTKVLLAENYPQLLPDESPKIVVLVPSPVAERRALATGQYRWPSSEFRIDGVRISYNDCLRASDPVALIGRMVGEIARILAYPRREYMLRPEQPPSRSVLDAYDVLREDFDSRPVPDLAGKRALAGATT